MKILLSPAKALDMDKKLASNKTTQPIFLEEASYLINKLQKFSANKIGKMMSLSKELSELNYQRYQDWRDKSELDEGTGSAAAVFNGEVYRGLDSISMTAGDLEFAQEHLVILSGLYGLLRPLDVIHPYRLEMGTKWAVTPSKKNLYQFWGKKLAEELNADNSDGIIVNLASNEYFKALDKKTLNGRVITCTFKEFKDGNYKVVMVYAKKARGFMARYIIDNRITDPEQMKLFDTDGYMYDVNQSTDNELVFTR